MNFYWDNIEKRVYTKQQVLDKGEDKFTFLKKIGVLELIVKDRGNYIQNYCILIKRDKYKVITKTHVKGKKNMTKYLCNLQHRGWVIAKGFEENFLRDVYGDSE